MSYTKLLRLHLYMGLITMNKDDQYLWIQLWKDYQDSRTYLQAAEADRVASIDERTIYMVSWWRSSDAYKKVAFRQQVSQHVAVARYVGVNIVWCRRNQPTCIYDESFKRAAFLMLSVGLSLSWTASQCQPRLEIHCGPKSPLLTVTWCRPTARPNHVIYYAIHLWYQLASFWYFTWLLFFSVHNLESFN